VSKKYGAIQFEPSRNGIAADLQYLTDLIDGMALITQQNGMRAPT
jgi:hypothetical protein|tara:strand:+ start:763 stop:897 length:135 start_codon:yes stop_codon:yes gene_type:complete